MNWHEPTEDEWEGKGDYKYIIDIIPDSTPHQAGVDEDTLIRIGKPGWSWGIIDVSPPHTSFIDMGYADTREAAIADAQARLARLREEDLEVAVEETSKKRMRWLS